MKEISLDDAVDRCMTAQENNAKLIPTDRDISFETRSVSIGWLPTRQRRYMNGIVATSSLGSLLWGYHFSVIAGAMLLIDNHYNLDVLWHELIVSILVGGATIGAATAGWLSDKFGRWKMMMCTAVLYGLGAIIMATSFSKFCLMVGRAIVGLALGTGFSIDVLKMYVCMHGSMCIVYACISHYNRVIFTGRIIYVTLGRHWKVYKMLNHEPSSLPARL